jgi:hypothetical protein
MTREALLAELMRIERRAVALEVLEHSDDDDEQLHPDVEASHRAELAPAPPSWSTPASCKYSPWEDVRARIFGQQDSQAHLSESAKVDP